MVNTDSEKTIAKLLGFGGAAVTIFVLTGSVTDPVNATKFFLLGTVSIGVLGILFTNLSKIFTSANKMPILASVMFVFFGALATFISEAPLVQSLYGNYGRNTGFLTYLFLTILFVAGCFLRTSTSFKIIEYGLFIACSVNIAYCAYVLLFGDFIGWNNPSGKILGTLGNPNFISALLGISVSIFAAKSFDSKIRPRFRFTFAVFAFIALYEVLASASLQGVVVAIAGLTAVIYFKIRSWAKSIYLELSLVAMAICAGAAGVLGTLQIGPLQQFLYKTSVSLRGEYWNAGITMGQSHFFGVGFDSYGDWYRSSRRPSALILPGASVVTNTAHNVFIDIYSAGGIILFVAYCMIILCTAIAIFRIFRKSKSYNSTVIVLVVAWLGYHLQSIISINQIGLAVWGWVLGGTLIGLSNSDFPGFKWKLIEKPSGSRKASTPVFSSGLIAGVGIVIGAIIAVPPLSADMRLHSAQNSGNAAQLESVTVPSYLNPQNSLMLNSNVSMFEQSKLPEFAHRTAIKNVKFNSNTFDAWRLLYFISLSTPDEKKVALQNMRRLDPLNPEVLKLS